MSKLLFIERHIESNGYMCHVSCVLFGVNHLLPEDVTGKSVLDVGSYDYNGNFSPVIRRLNPAKFVGIDMLPGPGVDIVCLAEDAATMFGENSFDTVVATELMEHVRNWREAISSLKKVCKPGGILFITTRSKGFKLHGYPSDYWRYELEDMRKLFADCEILKLESDPQAPGVFLKVRKPLNFTEISLKDYALYSMIENRRIITIDISKERKFQRKYSLYKKCVRLKRRWEGFVFRFIRKFIGS